MRKISLALAFLAPLSVAQFVGQKSGPAPYRAQSEGPLAAILDGLAPRQLGPTNMGGRISDLAVFEKEPRIMYVATASGGLWKTTNAGTTYQPIFDHYGSVSMGAVAVSQSNPDLLYVGTGEQSSRNSVAWGDGVYKSTDGGRNWKHIGLTETRHISKILIDPKNSDIVYVAAIGRLWGRSPERGLFKSTNGGKTWDHIFTVGDRAGVIDLEMDPKNPNILYASTWDRYRKPYVFASGGLESGLWKSTDAGKTWRKLTNGLPKTTVGRIGLSIYRKNPKIIAALVEFDAKKEFPPAAPTGSEKLPAASNPAQPGQAATAPPATERRPGSNEGNQAGGQSSPPVDPRMVTPSLSQMNGGGLFISKDAGSTWEFVKLYNPRPFYFSNPLIDPNHPNIIYVGGLNLTRSTDGGKTWQNVGASTHADHHTMWINPADSRHIITGCDGGIYVSRDGAQTWAHHNQMPLGQYYAVSFDGQLPYWVYGGLQDNGSWALPTATTYGGVGPWDAQSLNGGDGFYSEADPIESEWVYSESQGGAVARLNRKTGQRAGIRPSIPGERLRFNWNTPILISPHNNQTIYVGANRLMKSVDRGTKWEPISPDLTSASPRKLASAMIAAATSINVESTGAENHCTIVTISESPLVPGQIATGSDDGLVHITTDGGKSWTDVTPNIPGVPEGIWCSRVTMSKWSKNRVYALFDGHRSDDFKPYGFVSEDLGKTWKSITAGLPDFDSLYVIREGEHNPNLLLLGSEMSLRFSVDLGKSWSRLRGQFPTVAVHDLRIHPLMKDAVIGTHGRSIWTIDIAALEGMTNGIPAEPTLLGTGPMVLMPFTTGSPLGGDSFFSSPNPANAARVYFYNPAEVKETISLTVKVNGRDIPLSLGDSPQSKGLKIARWVPRDSGVWLPAGEYEVTMKVGERVQTSKVKILDPKSY